MTLIELVVVLIVVGVGLYLVGLIPMDNAIRTVIRVVVILAVVLWLLQTFGLFRGIPLNTRIGK